MRKTFTNQDLPNISSADRQHSAKPPIVAAARAFLPRPAGARHPRQAGIAGADKASKTLGSFLCSLALVIAACPVPSLWRIESDQAVHRTVGSHGIAVDHLDRAGLLSLGSDDFDVRRFVTV